MDKFLNNKKMRSEPTATIPGTNIPISTIPVEESKQNTVFSRKQNKKSAIANFIDAKESEEVKFSDYIKQLPREDKYKSYTCDILEGFSYKIMKDFEELKHIDEDDVNHEGRKVTNTKSVRKLGGQANLAIVLYGIPAIYSSDNEANSNIHISLSGEDVIKMLSAFFSCPKYWNASVYQITAGHEHGSKKKKCHFQCIVRLNCGLYKKTKPFELHYKGETLIGMIQLCRDTTALDKYCQKEGDFYHFDNERVVQKKFKKNKKGENTDQIDPFATIVANRDVLDNTAALNLVLANNPTLGVIQYRNIEYCLDKITKPQLPEFEWQELPGHIVERYPKIAEWYTNWCKPENMDRRKSLVLFSKTRSVGKTRFAQALVNHEDYYVIFRGTFTKDAIEKKIPKLLILDDMNSYNAMNKECWKALTASQPTAIREAYTNFLWNYRVPTIITTNNYQMVMNMMIEKEFKTQSYFIEIRDYMGPPETKIKGFEIMDQDISPEFEEDVRVHEHERNDFIENKKYEKMNKTNPKIFNVVQEDNEQKKKYEKLLEEHRNLKETNKQLNQKLYDYENRIKSPADYDNEQLSEIIKNNLNTYLDRENVMKAQIESLLLEKSAWESTNNKLIQTNYTLDNMLKDKKKRIEQLEEELQDIYDGEDDDFDYDKNAIEKKKMEEEQSKQNMKLFETTKSIIEKDKHENVEVIEEDEKIFNEIFKRDDEKLEKLKKNKFLDLDAEEGEEEEDRSEEFYF